MTADAVRDLEDIVDWIARHDGAARAELAALGIREFRETLFKPYRIVYGVEERRVPRCVPRALREQLPGHEVAARCL